MFARRLSSKELYYKWTGKIIYKADFDSLSLKLTLLQQ
jgi:hypothetical protein